MLSSLYIKDFVLIKELDLNFKDGFSALTGETGAGKSMLLDAMSLLKGDASESSLVRVSCDQAIITASFDISKNKSAQEFFNNQDFEIDLQEDIILKRVLSAAGRSKSYLNDQIVSSSLLKNLSAHLLDIQGQFDRFGQSLKPSDILDTFLKSDPILLKVKESFNSFKELEKSYKLAKKEYHELLDQKEELEKALETLEGGQVRVGEEEDLLQQRLALQNYEKISSNLDEALSFLGSSTFWSTFHKCQKNVEKVFDLGKIQVKEASQALERCEVELQEAASLLQKLSRGLDFNPKTYQNIEDRLHFLKTLARTYKVKTDELPTVLKSLQDRLSSLFTYEDRLNALETELESLKDIFIKDSLDLLKKRQLVAKDLEIKLHSELKDLMLKEAAFEVRFEELPENDWSLRGIHVATFWVAMNKGQRPSLLQESASGGELSRFQLAFKIVMSEILGCPTLFFDEIDTGVGGAVAFAMGQKMRVLGNTHQVIAITHAPQVAGLANNHFLIYKSSKQEQTISFVKELSAQERLEEIARMLSGENITDEAKAAAVKLLETKI